MSVSKQIDELKRIINNVASDLKNRRLQDTRLIYAKQMLDLVYNYVKGNIEVYSKEEQWTENAAGQERIKVKEMFQLLCLPNTVRLSFGIEILTSYLNGQVEYVEFDINYLHPDFEQSVFSDTKVLLGLNPHLFFNEKKVNFIINKLKS